MKLGIISESGFVITDNESNDWTIHSFTIATSELSFYRIIHSAFATPARYVEEIFLRLCALEKGTQPAPKFIFNPLYDLSRLDILLVLSALNEVILFEGITVLVDKNDIPAGYLFPSWIGIDDAHFVTLLSTVDGIIDTTLCGLLFQVESQRLLVPYLNLSRSQHNGFFYEENQHIYRWLAERALITLQSRQCHALKDIPFTVIMPHHAGDVLFFTLAFNKVHSHFKRIAVNRVYRDIVDDQAPNLAVVPIDAPPINRSGNLQQGKPTPDGIYFNIIKDYLMDEGFYYYCRSSRDYILTTFHLIDQFAFALGQRYLSEEDLITCQNQSPRLFQPVLPADEPKRILLHFDGGWPLKVYPKPQQKRLIDLLLAKGYAVTILDGEAHENTKCTHTTFKSYAQFKALLQSQHLLVGMDSFPSHYAAHVLGLPTICLFASTRPENSNAPAAPNYLYLERGLRCRPCYGVVKCPLHGKNYCDNFVSPDVVIAEIDRMLLMVRQPDVGWQGCAHPPADNQRKHLLPFPASKGAVRVRRISLKYLRAKVLLAALAGLFIPYFQFVLLLKREFTASLKREGLLLTYLRTIRYLRRTVLRVVS